MRISGSQYDIVFDRGAMMKVLSPPLSCEEVPGIVSSVPGTQEGRTGRTTWSATESMSMTESPNRTEHKRIRVVVVQTMPPTLSLRVDRVEVDRCVDVPGVYREMLLGHYRALQDWLASES
jgi:hypothetical protein